MNVESKAVGWVAGGRMKPDDDHWGEETARIELDPSQFDAGALAGLAEFSHLVVIYHFHRADPAKMELGARHPRGNTDWPKVGIFAQRGKNRPNHLGVSTCRILAVEGLSVLVQGLDAIDGTPVLDLKPWFADFGPRGPVLEPQWVAEIMKAYW